MPRRKADEPPKKRGRPRKNPEQQPTEVKAKRPYTRRAKVEAPSLDTAPPMIIGPSADQQPFYLVQANLTALSGLSDKITSADGKKQLEEAILRQVEVLEDLTEKAFGDLLNEEKTEAASSGAPTPEAKPAGNGSTFVAPVPPQPFTPPIGA
jgi:hypothetical protein